MTSATIIIAMITNIVFCQFVNLVVVTSKGKIEPRVGGGGGGRGGSFSVLLSLPAFLASVISSFFTQNQEPKYIRGRVGPQTPHVDPPLTLVC